MLSKHARLRAFEVREVLARGTSVRAAGQAPHLAMKFIKNGAAFRAAIVVSKSIARGAVARNRVRRAGYRALRELHSPISMQAVFFVQKIPPQPLQSNFRTQAQVLMQKIH